MITRHQANRFMSYSAAAIAGAALTAMCTRELSTAEDQNRLALPKRPDFGAVCKAIFANDPCNPRSASWNVVGQVEFDGVFAVDLRSGKSPHIFTIGFSNWVFDVVPNAVSLELARYLMAEKTDPGEKISASIQAFGRIVYERANTQPGRSKGDEGTPKFYLEKAILNRDIQICF